MGNSGVDVRSGTATPSRSGRRRLGRLALEQATDAELVERSLDGESSAFGVLYERHRQAVTTAVAARVGLGDAATDITQDVFTTAMTRLAQLSDHSRFRPWVLQIGRNAAIDVLRARQRRGPVECFDDLVQPPKSTDPGPDTVAELHALGQKVRTGFEQLGARDATALGLAIHFGFGPNEMAAALGVTPGNAKVILHRARRRLRDAVAEELT